MVGNMKRIGMTVVAVAAVALGFAGTAQAQKPIIIYTSNDATLNKLVATEFTKATGVQADVVSPPAPAW